MNLDELREKGIDCNDCYLSMQNCHDMSILFDDGTELKLLDAGLSTQEIVELAKLHGRCVVSHERIIRW